MLGKRRRRRTNIDPTLGICLVFAVNSPLHGPQGLKGVKVTQSG